MRTTLTLDDDVVALLKKVEQEREETRKEVVNAALRLGLQVITKPRETRQPFRTGTLPNGPSLLANMDNIGEVLAWAEGEDHR